MSDLGALYAALRTVLTDTTSTTPIWAARAYADQVPASTPTTPIARPYVVYSFAGGGDDGQNTKPDPNILVDVMCVADDFATANTGAEQIRQRLDDRGEQEPTHSMVGDSTYTIKTMTQERRLHFVEQVSGATQIYHSGARYRAIMEKR